MIRKLCLLLLLSGFTTGFAQQNLFNIPSADITPKNKFFYQHQLNVYSKKVESKSHLVYGLGDGWDAGMNLVGKGAYFTPEWNGLYNSDAGQGALYPVLMGTLQKQVPVFKKLNLNVGTQMGVNLSNKVYNKKINYFNYALASYQLGEGRRLIAGGYFSNRMFTGTGNVAGALVGFEYKLTKHWYLMGDWVSGRNDAGVGVLGAMYVLSKRIQLCGGYAIANPNTPKPNAIVFELNWLGWDYH
ncbi:hypothetical protein CAP35_01680 [Chitinophagaceae bacterium IBVUCB1]|nr:hypothetical protein CAP35_01680 [Chitinophagaceae bacterium IBVUCB1]